MSGGGTFGRSYSDKYVSGMSEFDLYKNKNIDWTGGKFTRIFYLVFIILVWALLHVSQFFSPEDCWTVTNIMHLLVIVLIIGCNCDFIQRENIQFQVTFVIFHWIKGCPDDSTQGEYNGLTLYEQIDAGVPWTATKKFLMLVPTLLTWLACHVAEYKPFYVVINCGIFLICIIAKIPEMYRVRIFGINSTVGIDSPTDLNRDKKD